MTTTTEELLRAVSRTLFEQVLPELPPATWVASNVRACAMLLVYLEDRVATERPMLRSTNAMLRHYLRSVADGKLSGGPEDRPLTEGLAATLERFATMAPEAEVGALREENRAYKQALERIVTAATEGRSDAAFRGELRGCLAALDSAEQAMTERANRHVPL